MPNTSPSSSILKRLGFNLPQSDPNIDTSNQDKIARQQQAAQPLWKQYARNAIDAPVGALKGYLGMGSPEDASSGEYVANKLFQQTRDPDPYLSKLTQNIPGMTGDMAQGISMFPNRGARILGTNAFREAADDAPKNIGLALHEFADKYPRIAAHMKPTAGESYVRGANASLEIPGGKVAEPMLTKFTKLGREKAAPHLDAARNMVFHEGTHAAQALGNSDTQQLYINAHKLGGYEQNPFEINARNSGQRNYPGAPVTNRININENLANLAQERLNDPRITRSVDTKLAAEKIQEIQKRRGVLQSAYGNPQFDEQIRSMERGIPSFELLNRK